MSEATRDVQRDIALTRERMSETIAALDARISSKVAVVKEKLDLAEVARDHPWPALAVAVGLGVLLAGTGADTKAAHATARAVKRAPSATVDLARQGVEAAVSVVRRDRDDADQAPEVAEPSLADRVRDRVSKSIGVDELIGQMRTAAEQLGRPASYAGQKVPTNTGQRL